MGMVLVTGERGGREGGAPPFVVSSCQQSAVREGVCVEERERERGRRETREMEREVGREIGEGERGGGEREPASYEGGVR